MNPEPISNPPTGPIQPAQEPSSNKPMVGSGEEGGPKPFSLPPEPLTKGAEGVNLSELPTPLDVAKDARGGGKWSADVMEDNISGLKNKLSGIQTQLQDPRVTSKFSPDHYTAIGQVTDRMNGDLKTIANYSGQGQQTPVTREKGQSLLEFAAKWIDGSQTTLSNALNYVGTMKQPNPTDYLKLQMAVQRATQKGELFASIIGASVSGIKTIMSTQLG